MIVLEFLVFVVSSGLFCSERFRAKLWAVLSAGAIATGSSLLFVYDLGARLAGVEKPPAVITKVVKQVVVKQVQNSQPASAGKPHSCAAQYPSDALQRHEAGVTSLAFRILTDGTVDAIKVLASSGSSSLDDAAVKCVSDWHYRPAIKNGQLAETPWKAKVTWTLPSKEDIAQAAGENAAAADAAKPASSPEAKSEPAAAPAETRHWYQVWKWFGGGEAEKKEN
ncbi:MAG TPA: energy transducer TonB [Rhizomicrobium sp.]|nr:energy transducer TonB [Rhizomicrobium sp.]